MNKTSTPSSKTSTSKPQKKRKIPKCKCCDNQIDDTCHMIYGKKGREQNLEGLILDCIGRKVTESAGSNQVICDDCYERLKQIQKFKQDCAIKKSENNVSESDEDDDDEDDDDEEEEVHPAPEEPVVPIQAEEEVLKEVEEVNEKIIPERVEINNTPEPTQVENNKIDDKILEKNDEEEVSSVSETKLDSSVKKTVNFGGNKTLTNLKLISTSGLKLTKFDPKMLNSKLKIDPKKLKPVSTEILSKLGNFNKFRQGIVKTPDPPEPIKEIELEIYEIPEPKKLKLEFDEKIDPEPLIELKDDIPENFEIVTKNLEIENKIETPIIKETFKREPPIDFVDNNSEFPELLTEMIPQPEKDFEEELSFTKIDKKNDINKLEVMTEEELVKILGSGTEDGDSEFYSSKLNLNSSNNLSGINDSESDSSNEIFTNKFKQNFGCTEVVDPFDYNETIEFTSMQHNDDNTGQFQEGFACRMCGESLKNHLDLLKHVIDNHRMDKTYLCPVTETCEKFSSISQLSNHLMEKHYDEKRNTNEQLICTSCFKSQKTKEDFGKHLCCYTPIVPGTVESKCKDCNEEFSSKRRAMFHQQFHMSNPRPKICLVCLKQFSNEDQFYNHVMFEHEKKIVYFCTMCDKTFFSDVLLKAHIPVHVAARNYPCNICEKSFLDRSTLQLHMNSASHLSEKPFKCTQCNKSYRRKARLTTHLASHTKPKSLVPVCDECSMILPSEAVATDHYLEEHPLSIDSDSVRITNYFLELVYCCEFCEKSFRDIESLNNHRKCHLGVDKPFICDKCPASFDAYRKLKTHQIASTKCQTKTICQVLRHYVCDDENCKKTYQNWQDLRKHVMTIHNITKDRLICNICNEEFPNYWSLSYHRKRVHETQIEYKCEHCGMDFKTKIGLNKHETIHQKEDVHCVKCLAKFDNRAELIKHNDQTTCLFKCEACDLIFNSRSMMAAHKRVIHEKMEHVCNNCGKEFPTLIELKLHKKIHIDEKRHNCNFCSYTGRTSSMLTEHLRVHTNERPYPCPICGLKFKRSYAMKNHLKLHTGEKNFLCTYEDCAKAFRSYAELNCHVKLRHLGIKRKVKNNKSSVTIEQNVATEDSNYIVMYQEDSTPSDDISTNVKSDQVLNNYIKGENNLAEFNTETGEMQHIGENSMSAPVAEPMMQMNLNEIDPSLIEASESHLNNMETNQLGEILEGNEGLDIQNLIQSQHLAYDEDGNIVMSQDYFIQNQMNEQNMIIYEDQEMNPDVENQDGTPASLNGVIVELDDGGRGIMLQDGRVLPINENDEVIWNDYNVQ